MAERSLFWIACEHTAATCPAHAPGDLRRAGAASRLALAKAIAWWFSGSVSLLAGFTDSLLDGAASLLNLLAVHYALRPADEDHRYGHGKAEALAGLGQALFIGASALSGRQPRH